MTSPTPPASPVETPGCQLNWEWLQQKLNGAPITVTSPSPLPTLATMPDLVEGTRIYYKAGTGCVWTLTYLPSLLGATYPWKVDGPAFQVFHGSPTGVVVNTVNNVGGTFSAPLSGIYDYVFACGLMRQNNNVISFMGARVDNTVPTTLISITSELPASAGGAGGPVLVRDHTITLLKTDVLQAKYQMATGTNGDFFSMASYLTPNQVG